MGVLMKIGQLADAVGVGVETVRYYERRGLLEPPLRTEAGYRQYGASDVARLEFLLRAKELGFTLAEISELFAATTDDVAAIIADLPTNVADPLERVAACKEAMNAAKHQLDLIPADILSDVTQTASPVVATAAASSMESKNAPDASWAMREAKPPVRRLVGSRLRDCSANMPRLTCRPLPAPKRSRPLKRPIGSVTSFGPPIMTRCSTSCRRA